MSKKEPNVVHQLNKKTGAIYVYENYPYWDKQKKQGRAKRKCIGKVDPSTGEVVPTHKRKNKEDNAKIDVSGILKHLEENITGGLQSGEFSLTDISLLISSAVKDMKKKIVSDVEKIVQEKTKDESDKTCENCNGTVKKTIKEIKPK